MVLTYESILIDEEIQYILNQQEVYTAQQKLDTKSSGSVYFTLSLPSSIKTQERKHVPNEEIKMIASIASVVSP